MGDGSRPIPNARCAQVQFALTVPAIRDRAAEMAAVLVLEPIFEADLQPEQYAYRCICLLSKVSVSLWPGKRLPRKIASRSLVRTISRRLTGVIGWNSTFSFVVALLAGLSIIGNRPAVWIEAAAGCIDLRYAFS